MKSASIIVSLLLLSSCYTYQTFNPEEYAIELANKNNPNQQLDNKKLSRDEINSKRDKANNGTSVSKNVDSSTKNAQPTVDISSVRMIDVIQPDKFYKVDFEGKQYTIEAKQWKADTLYAVVKGTEKELKFNQKDIADLKIRKFSKGKSDALTIAAYALGGVGIYLLLK
jgi:hypothetical protein